MQFIFTLWQTPEIMHEEYVFFELNMDTLNSFTLFRKYATNQNHKGKGYAFKDFIPTVFGKRQSQKRQKIERQGRR